MPTRRTYVFILYSKCNAGEWDRGRGQSCWYGRPPGLQVPTGPPKAPSPQNNY